ncbi:MAG: hypothetical protein KBS81_08940 [Spirochaetales bacterium]|nr:hypothetical protein [Candidatus Physcosoma equi]
MSFKAPTKEFGKVGKIIGLLFFVVLGVIAGTQFWELRHFKEVFVSAPGLTEVQMLSDYLPSLKGTWADTPIFIYDSGVEGGSVLYSANVHPYEPATSLSAYILMENIEVTKGKVYVIPQTNRSGSTLGSFGNAYPRFFHVESEYGTKQFRIGNRESNPLDQWPDPFTYVHFPSMQNLAYQDIRNMNRTYPGRENGTLTERASYAVMELIRQNNIDISIDVHEASIMYPVVATYVTHQRAEDPAMMASMMLSAMNFDMKCEVSPSSLHGLSHREWGDFSDTLAILMETPEPFIDRVPGPMTEALFVDGRDEFLQAAADRHLVYPTSYSWNEEALERNLEEDPRALIGFPLWYRVGRHLSGAMEMINMVSMFDPDKAIEVYWPSYEELEAYDCGYFFHDDDPANAPTGDYKMSNNACEFFYGGYYHHGSKPNNSLRFEV